MDGIPAKDGDRLVDWGLTSDDYAAFRPGYPDSFFERLGRELGLALPGLRVLDLGCGTGALSRGLARRGARVTGIDVAEDQVRAARRLAAEEGLDARFEVRAAEDTGEPPAAYDLVTASSCWLYFDAAAALDEVRRVAAPGGRLMTCHLCWLPRLDAIARASEELVLRHNPEWGGADWPGEIARVPGWTPRDFVFLGALEYDEALPFTRETWRGRFRACRGVGATMTAEEVARFDAEHAALLERVADPEFTVLHRIDAHLLGVDRLGTPGPAGAD